MISGKPIEKFKQGWALMPLSTDKVHYWNETTDIARICKHGRVRFYKSLCGLKGHSWDSALPLSGGDFNKCLRCERIANKNE